jgi:non-ribosomal peptide synthetase component E (peptide arylation enzyme)
MNNKGKQMDALLHHLLRSSAARFPGKEAIVHRNRRMTCAGTWRAVTSLASRLKSAGLERGDRLGVFLDASIPQALSIFAALNGRSSVQFPAANLPISRQAERWQ